MKIRCWRRQRILFSRIRLQVLELKHTSVRTGRDTVRTEPDSNKPFQGMNQKKKKNYKESAQNQKQKVLRMRDEDVGLWYKQQPAVVYDVWH